MRRLTHGALPALLIVLMLSVTALGATHRVADFVHGILDVGGSFYNSTFQAIIIDDDGTGPNANLRAGLYHRAGDGSYGAPSCFNSGAPRTTVYCNGPSGSLPCQKYAWTDGQDPQSNLAWHGHNPAGHGCP